MAAWGPFAVAYLLVALVCIALAGYVYRRTDDRATRSFALITVVAFSAGISLIGARGISDSSGLRALLYLSALVALATLALWGLTTARRHAPEQVRVGVAASGVFCILLGAYLFTHSGSFMVSDGTVMFMTTEALVEHHTLALAPNPGLLQITEGHDGRYYSKYGLGQPLLATLPYMLAQRLHPIAESGMWQPALLAYVVSLFNQFVTAFSGAMLFLLAHRLGNRISIAAAVALIWGLSTIAWPYAVTFFSEPLFTACLITAALGLLAYAQTSGRARFAWLALAGLALGWAIVTRSTGVLLAPAFLVYALVAASGHPEGRPLALVVARIRRQRTALQTEAHPWLPSALAATLAFGAPFLGCLALTLWHNYVRFGDVFDNGYAGESFSTPLWKGAAGLLFSPGKSLFVYAPILALACIGWPRFWRQNRAMAALCAAVAVILILTYARWWTWWGGWCWGPRFLVPAVPFLILGLGPLLASARWARIAAAVLTVAGAAIALLGVLVDATPHAAALSSPSLTAEERAYFDPGRTPVVAHARFLLHGEHQTVATFDLERIGLSPLTASAFPVLVVALFLVGVLLLAGACRASPWRRDSRHGAYAARPSPPVTTDA
jgi:hypothetical protein